MSADEKHGVTNIDNSPDKHCEPLAWCSLKRPPEEGIVAAHDQTKRHRIVKPKGKPRRPLSGYNVFFKEERGKWDISAIQSSVANSKNKEDSAFRTMTKAIGKRWRDLSADQKLQYEQVASADMQRYRKEMDEYKLKLIHDTAIGRVYLKGRLIKVSGTPEISYRDVSQQLPQTMKDIEGSQASSPDIQSIAGGEARSSKEVQSTQNASFTTEWTASRDTTSSRQALSRTNPSLLENLSIVQERACDESRGSFMVTTHQYNKWNEQTQQKASGRNEKAEPSSEFRWEMMRLEPVTPSNNAEITEADLQSSLSSFIQRHEASQNNRSTAASEVNPSAPTDVTYFVQQQQLPSHLQNVNLYLQSVKEIASPDAMMSEQLSSRILQRILLSGDNHTPHINSTPTHSAHAPTQHQPTLFDDLSLGIGSGLQTTRSVMDFLTSQNFPLPNDQRQSQWREQVSDFAASDFDLRLHSNMAMQLMQRAQQSSSLLRPVHFATPCVLSLSPNTSFHIPGYTMAAGADARAQIAFETNCNTTSAASCQRSFTSDTGH